MTCSWLPALTSQTSGSRAPAASEFSSQLVLRLWVPRNTETVSPNLGLTPEPESVQTSKNYSLLAPALGQTDRWDEDDRVMTGHVSLVSIKKIVGTCVPVLLLPFGKNGTQDVPRSGSSIHLFIDSLLPSISHPGVVKLSEDCPAHLAIYSPKTCLKLIKQP